jgi:hypothetical protein
MEDKRTLLTYHDLTVEADKAPDKELLDHLHSTVLGQPGGFRYQHTNLKERLSAPGENYFLYLRKSGKMLGSVGFCGKPSQVEGKRFDSWLIRYFSIKAPMRTVPKKRKEKTELKDDSKRTTVLGRFIQPVFANPSLLRGTGEEGEGPVDQQGPAIIYAIIEQKNLRSMNFSTQMGLETIGEMASFSFSRLRPSKSSRMEQLAAEDQAGMLMLLQEFYRDYTLFISNPLFRNNDYYVIREASRVVAGLQIYHVTWRIVDIGSGPANTLLRLLSRIPWFQRRFDPERVRLLAFDGIYCEKGYESALYELMEGILEKTSTYLAMLMIDRSSDLFRIFETNQKLGLLHKLFGTFSADIRVRFINMPEQIRHYFLTHPTYIPTYDNS